MNLLASPLLLAISLCFSGLATPEPPPSPWLHALIPVVALGTDIQDLRHATDARVHPLVDLEHRTHRMTRWTVGLRWTTPTPRQVDLTPSSAPLPTLCDQWAHLRQIRPSTLSEALDHWILSETLRSLAIRHLELHNGATL